MVKEAKKRNHEKKKKKKAFHSFRGGNKNPVWQAGNKVCDVAELSIVL